MNRYYNDLWEFDTEALAWEPVACKDKGPAPRGGCQLALHGDMLFVFGGHSVLKEGGEERDKVHDDVWALDLSTLQVCTTARCPVCCHFPSLHLALQTGF